MVLSLLECLGLYVRVFIKADLLGNERPDTYMKEYIYDGSILKQFYACYGT